MASVTPYLQEGPDTREVSASVTGGMLVEPDPGNAGKIRPASANSTTVLGVAASDAEPAGSAPTDPVNFAYARSNVAVYYGDVDMNGVTYSAAVAEGQLVACTGNGQVGPYTEPAAGAAATSNQIVGRCTQPGGVTAAGAGRLRLSL